MLSRLMYVLIHLGSITHSPSQKRKFMLWVPLCC
ncbi:hypothetical protein H5410_033510 [Solanum commersonii]|uniref:Uncharacterized protein n=1 Tax=Solanum commersonii TaxID=4109 RepID=A0A9J5YST5_SOLCO|nr:hypothetical protein H5410_033510 [Solanum commersonii]